MAAALSCVKMRASLGGAHISGAERIVATDDVPAVMAALYRRAAAHERGCPDAINIKVEALAAEPARRLLRHELPHARHAEGGLLHRLGHLVERPPAHGL